MNEEELGRALLTAGATSSAIAFALLGVITSLRQTGRMAGLGRKALNAYFLIQLFLLTAVVLGVSTSLVALWQLAIGNHVLFLVALALFILSTAWWIPLGIWIVARLR